jgi:hypothetical protein
MSTKHTDGPWTVDQDELRTGVYAEFDGYHGVSAGTQGAGGWTLTGFIPLEDAQLIASAPDLLAALEHLTETLAPWLVTADAGLPAVPKTIGDCADLHTAQRDACAAIKRAGGWTE